jgi:hypothetical protein
MISPIEARAHALNDDESAAPTALNALAKIAHLGLELRLWVATCVTALSAFAFSVSFPSGHYNAATRIDALLVVFLATLLLYNIDGSLDAPRDGPRPIRFALHLTVSALALGPLLYLLTRLPGRAGLLAGVGALLCSLYALPLPWLGHGLRLKQIPYVKAPFVGFSVATAVIWVPLAGERLSLDRAR